MNKRCNGLVFTMEKGAPPRKKKESATPSAPALKGVSKAKSKQIGFTFTFKDDEPAPTKKSAVLPAEKSAQKPSKQAKAAPKVAPGQKKFIFSFEVDKSAKDSVHKAGAESAPAVKKLASTRGRKPAAKVGPMKEAVSMAEKHSSSKETGPSGKAPPAVSSARAAGKRAGKPVAATSEEKPAPSTTIAEKVSSADEIGECWQDLDAMPDLDKDMALSIGDGTPSVQEDISKAASTSSPAEQPLTSEKNEMSIAPSVIRSIPSTPMKAQTPTPSRTPRNSMHFPSVAHLNTAPLQSKAATPILNRKRMTIGPEDVVSPVKIRRLSLDAFDARKCSIFQTRRESLFGYDQIYGGSVSPEDFYRHSNISQPAKTRTKQILLWIAKYISNGHLKIDGLTEESTQKICTMYMRQINELVLPEQPKTKEDSHIVDNAKSVIVALQDDTAKYRSEIEKWKEVYSTLLHSYTLKVPLFAPEENMRRLSIHRQSMNGLVSFDATVIGCTPVDTMRALSRRLEELHSSLNSSRYFLFLSLEYTKKVCGSLLEASHPLDKSKANALLHVLCKISRKVQV
ncbi:uncharacterized protein NESG_00140 [Nematocida ausubeli]|uniref:Uncharacterized protein n=2 Tax=Nematocida ausubeli (strain ATCC PRA-371 / ERTm2) TaxID=1913371 RepID=A0A086J4J8_NEMA1|nr:uncharacterized protein NESG_00140 [Nematocida ausubeli]KAI5135868.1 hypothetical protein NEAUS07_1386 [Nematocida ausubeli]KFG27066.1 hypothetical protein NESG_00140 [Nematocida ausubeli]